MTSVITSGTSLSVLAQSFVQWFSKHEYDCLELKTLPDGELNVLSNVLKEAGFEIEGVAPGKLADSQAHRGYEKKAPLINPHFPFRAVDERGEGVDFATGWLDCLFHLVSTQYLLRKNKDTLCEQVEEEIRRNRPMALMQLSSGEDPFMLAEESPTRLYHSALPYLVEHVRDTNELGPLGRDIGIHKYCGAPIFMRRATGESDCLICKVCGRMPILVSKGCKTYGDLRRNLRLGLTVTGL